MNFFANLFRFILIIAVIGGIGYGVYALFFKPVSTTNVMLEYDAMLNSQSNKTIQSNINWDNDNELIKYSETLDSIYDEVLLLYSYEWEIISELLPEASFGNANGKMTDISRLLVNYQDSIDVTADALMTFNADKQSFGATPTAAQINILDNEFKYITNCLLDQTKILTNINAKLVSYVKSEVYGGDNVAKFNTKYLYMEALNMQGITLLNVLTSEQGVVGEKLFGNSKTLFNNYKVSRSTNFSVNNSVITDKFFVDYNNIDKQAFFYAMDKNKYYNDLTDTELKSRVETVMIYFGFIINTLGGE